MSKVGILTQWRSETCGGTSATSWGSLSLVLLEPQPILAVSRGAGGYNLAGVSRCANQRVALFVMFVN